MTTLLRLAAALTYLFLAEIPALCQQPDNDYINPDRPGIADGSTTVGRGHIQFETAFQEEFRHNGAEHDNTVFVPTLLRYGFAMKWEVRVEGNTYTWRRVDDPHQGLTSADGIAPISGGLKYNFCEALGSKRPSVGAIIRIFPPSGSGQYRNGKTMGDVRVAADWNFASEWSLNPNLGIAIYQDGSARMYEAGLLAMTLNFNPSQKINFFIDAGIQTPERKYGATSATVDIGSAYIIGHNTQLDLSIGTGVTGTSPPHPFIAGGLSRRF